MKITYHPESAVSFEECGRVDRPYKPNYDVALFINQDHEKYSMLPCNGPCIIHPIEGWLQRADALKLYELAYYSDGDICEFGTAYGLSTSIISQAVIAANATREKKIYIETVELDSERSHEAKRNIEKMGLASFTNFNEGDAEKICQKFIDAGKKFSFVFIDFNHSYWPTFRLSALLHNVLSENALVLYHDYNDPTNTKAKLETEHATTGVEYGVYQAVHDGLEQSGLKFVGVYGCCGLFRYS